MRIPLPALLLVIIVLPFVSIWSYEHVTARYESDIHEIPRLEGGECWADFFATFHFAGTYKGHDVHRYVPRVWMPLQCETGALLLIDAVTIKNAEKTRIVWIIH
jgi:hypothetical protein